MRIAVLNGPNLNLLGTREPAIYGSTTLAGVERRLRPVARELGVTLSFTQRNGEGQLIDAIHALRGRADGVILNAGAYSHTSLAIRDALAGVGLPFVEVHVTNVYAREPERHHSMLAPAARAVLCGFGPAGYELALRGLAELLGAVAPPHAPSRGLQQATTVPRAAGRAGAAATGVKGKQRRRRRG